MKRFTLMILAFGIFSSLYAEDLILSAPPRETPDAGMKLYGPLADHLGKLLGVRVIYQHPTNWLKYQREMRNDKYDIIFDGPHFIAWRIAHLHNKALVKLPGLLQFNLVIDSNNQTIKSAKDLIGKKICGIPPPNLSTLWVLDAFRNPVRQPIIKGIKGGMPKVFKALIQDKKCDAAVLRTDFQNKILKKEQQEKLKTILTSKAMPNQGISVSKRVTPELRVKIIQSLTAGGGIASTMGIIKRYAKKAKSFIPVKEGEYEGYNNLLEGVIFGW